jgi:hypothetical protein
MAQHRDFSSIFETIETATCVSREDSTRGFIGIVDATAAVAFIAENTAVVSSADITSDSLVVTITIGSS